MKNFARYGLAIALLVFVGVTCILLALTPTAERSTQTTVHLRTEIHEVTPVPHLVPNTGKVTTDA